MITDKEIYKQIFDRHRALANPCYINVFAGDDQKKKNKIYSVFFNLHEKKDEFLMQELETYNIGSFGVFMNFNILEKPQRTNANITKILYVFIDLDDANEEHNNLIKVNLKNKGISYSYNAKSGHGYHFLIPVDFKPENKDKVKGFLTYLKNNVCDKVDVATHTNERLLRAPESLHNKDKDSKLLETLSCDTPTEEEIEKNTELVLKFQEEQKKREKDVQYAKSIVREDIFFSTILNDSVNWAKYKTYLSGAKDRNSNFIKNLGLFVSNNPGYLPLCDSFLNQWEPSRIAAVQGWAKKAEQGFNVNYAELLKWCRDNSITEWISLLELQLKTTFLDDYEVYYLEDERKENAFLLYYPERDYYVQKSLPEVLLTIYYDCSSKGMDLAEEMSLDSMPTWDDMPFKQKNNMILNSIHKLLDEQKRIKMVFNIGYEPSDNKFISYESKKYFNTYNKTALWDYSKEQKSYHFPKIKELILNLCDKKQENYDYLCKWIAWQIKNPEIKLPTALILQGRQGSGKGTFKDLILDNIFGNNCQEINQTHLESSFNEYLLGKQIIVANEVMHNENRQTLPNVLKNLVTDKKITISRKFKKEIVGRNFTHWIFCTNSDNPIKIEADDRRYSVFYSEKLRNGLPMEIRENLDYELKEFISYLKQIEVNFEEVSKPIMTEAKEDIIELNKDSLDKFQEYLLQYSNLYEAFVGIYGHDQAYHTKNSFGDSENYILTEKVYLLYQKWSELHKERGVYSKQNFCKRLSNKRIKSLPKREKDNIFRMYNVAEIEEKLLSEGILNE